jgi:GntR family transcriptional repressor for pyruvate dehydrogenase complex
MNPSDYTSAIKPVRLSRGRSSAAAHLREWIQSNQLGTGARLPSERELAEQLQVSRTTLREAISTLEAIGLLEVRHGSGCYVTGQVSQTNLAAIWKTWYAVHHDELIHLLQVRNALETKAAALAVCHATPTIVDELHTMVEAMQSAAERGNLTEVARLDDRFHSTIVGTSGNPILVELLSSLRSALEGDRLAVFSLEQRLERSLKDHRAIVSAFGQRDAEAVQRALHRHYESVLQDVSDRRGSGGS